MIWTTVENGTIGAGSVKMADGRTRHGVRRRYRKSVSDSGIVRVEYFPVGTETKTAVEYGRMEDGRYVHIGSGIVR